MLYTSPIWRWLTITLFSRRFALWIIVLFCVISVVTFLFRTSDLKPDKPSYLGLEVRGFRGDIDSKRRVPNESRVPNAKTFTILFWNNGERMVRRFVRSYGAVEKDPLRHCDVKNCVYRTDGLAGLNQSDAVVFHLHRIKGPDDVPPYRLPNQRWVFFTDESPMHTFYLAQKKDMKYYNGIFNWSMTYSMDADVPVPYGRTRILTEDEKADVPKLQNYFLLNSKTTAVVGSNCGGINHRWDFVRELRKHTSVDVYGGCGNLKCPGGYMGTFCPLIRGYKFYLAFENCNCKEYITEKLWWNAFTNEAIPVVMGATTSDYRKLCPPNSFIHVEDFEDPKSLALYLNFLSKNETAYNSYFAWKTSYKVVNEHGYFHSNSMHICHLCQALNDPSKERKIYNNLEDIWSPRVSCRGPKWNPS